MTTPMFQSLRESKGVTGNPKSSAMFRMCPLDMSGTYSPMKQNWEVEPLRGNTVGALLRGRMLLSELVALGLWVWIAPMLCVMDRHVFSLFHLP